jgi:transcriptional regulator with XRE-family HTH domain
MGRAGKALKQVLDTYGITQNQLAVAMGIRRSNVSRWVSEIRDPVAETMLEIRDGLQKINPERLRSLLGFTLVQQLRMRSRDSGRSAIAFLFAYIEK